MARQKLIHLHGTGELKDASKLNLGEIAVRNAAAGTAELYILNEEGNDLVKFMDAKAVADAIKVVSDKVGTQDVKDQLDALERSLQGEISAAQGDAEDYADGLNTAMDARVAKLEAQDEYKKAEVDKQISDAQAAAQEAAQGYADGLNTAMDARVDALEAIDHDHANMSVLTGITAEKVAAWDAAEQNAKDELKNYATTAKMAEDIAAAETRAAGVAQTKAEAAEAAAKEHADDLNTAMDERVAELEKIDHNHTNKAVLDGIDADKVAAWDAAVTDLNDFLTGTDTDKVVNKLSDIRDWMEGEGVVATELTEAIAGEADLRTKADAALSDRIAAFEGEGAGSVKAQIEAAKTAAVNAATGYTNTLINGEGGLDSRLDALEAQDKYVKAEVDKQISDAQAAAEKVATDFNTAMDARVDALEAIDHDHANMSVLTGITAEKVAAWDAAEQNAKDELKNYATTAKMAEDIAAAETRAAGVAQTKAEAAQTNAINAATGYTATQLQSYSTTEQMNEAIKTKVETLDANLTGTGANTGIDVTVAQVDGVITTVTVDDSSLVIDCGRYDA